MPESLEIGEKQVYGLVCIARGLKNIVYGEQKALKHPFLRKGMGVDLPITISH